MIEAPTEGWPFVSTVVIRRIQPVTVSSHHGLAIA
jgi:hypothetical protein